MTVLQVLLGILGVVLIALLVELRRRIRPPSTRHVGDQLKLSPDGKFWWDGHDWMPIGPPPASPSGLSPDGNWWWDGTRWLPSGRTSIPPGGGPG